MNVGSIVDKYFSDTLVETKKIMDDHFGHVVLVSFSFGGVVPMDGHAIAKIHILEQEERENPMRIFLDENEIKQAIQTYVDEHVDLPVQDLLFNMTDDGLSVEVVTGEGLPPMPSTKPKGRGGRPKGSKNKPKATEPEVDDDDAAENNTEDGSDGTDTGSDQQAENDTPSGEEDSDKPSKGSTKNLFGEEDNQSSESDAKATDKDNSPKTDETSVKTIKKSSIFDVG